MGNKAADETPTFAIDGFEPVEKLGSGGFGVVWKARQERIGRLVAIKVSGTVLETEEKQLFFDRECESLGRLSGHPNIVQIHTTGHLDDGRPYLVLEYVEGGTLTSRLQQVQMSEPAIIDLGLDLFRALSEAHKAGVLHRDVKPDNVLLRADGTAVLGDFGIAQLQDTTKSRAGTVIGSLRYIAPEVLRGEPPTTASDLYGVGITMLTAMTRKAPFEGTSNLVDQVMHRVLKDPPDFSAAAGYSKPLRTIVENLVAKAPADRPTSASEAALQLSALSASGQSKPDEIFDAPKTTLAKPPSEPPVAKTADAAPPKSRSAPKPTGPPPARRNPTPAAGTKAATADPADIAATRIQTEVQPSVAADKKVEGPNGTTPYPAQKTNIQAKPPGTTPPQPPTQTPTKPPTPPSSELPAPNISPPPPASVRAVPRPTPSPIPLPRATVLFEGVDHTSAESLASALSTHWDRAVHSLSDAQSRYLGDQLSKVAQSWNRPQVGSLIQQFPTAPPRRKHQLMTDLIIELHPKQTPTYRGWDISLSTLQTSAASIPPAIIDEIRRGEILVRWRHHPDMVGIVEAAQEWEQSIREYDHRNAQLQISDLSAGGKLLACAGDYEAPARIKSRLLTSGDHSEAGRQPWWADLYSSDSTAGLLLAESTATMAAAQTKAQQVEEDRNEKRRSLRNGLTIAVAALTTLVCGVAAYRWHSSPRPTEFDQIGTGWFVLAAVPFVAFWYLLASSNRRGLVAGGCLGSISWVAYAFAIAAVGTALAANARLDPTTSAFGLFLASSVITVPLFTLLTFRRLSSRLKPTQTPGMVTHLSR